jgi:fused signal recognition particle receptor
VTLVEHLSTLSSPEILASAAGVAAGVILLLVWVLLRRSRPASAAGAKPKGKAAPSRQRRAPLLTDGLSKTRSGLLARLQNVWGRSQDANARLAGLEEALLMADVGLEATSQLLARLRSRAPDLADAPSLKQALSEEMLALLADGGAVQPLHKPHVILVAGVNGVGKTTTIGKLAHRHRQEGRTVMLVAADTFRAAAAEQLQQWAQRVGADCVHHQSGADPSAVAHDGLAAARARGIDVVIIDTAGRLHVKVHLVEELKKVARVIGRQIEGAPHEVLLVIDATTGQNAINQARVFQEALSLTGIVLTKLDGTAKGGAAFAVHAELGVPIRFVGVGEAVDDLLPFDAATFVDALLAPGDATPA